MVLVAAEVGVLHLQGAVGFLHQKGEVVALQEEGVLEQQEQAEQPAQMVVLGVQVMAEEVVQVLGVQLLEVLLEGVLVQMATAEYSWSPKYLHHLHRLLLFPAFQDGLLPIVKKSARRKSTDIRDLVLGSLNHPPPHHHRLLHHHHHVHHNLTSLSSFSSALLSFLAVSKSFPASPSSLISFNVIC